MTQPAGDELTLREVLFEQKGDTGLRNAMRDSGATAAVDGRLGALSPGLRPIARDEVVSIIAGVLDLKLVDVLAAGWRKWEDLAGAARRTLESPGQSEIVELVDHRIMSTHRPHVDVTLDGEKLGEIWVQVDIVVELHALTAVVSGGRLSALRTGRATLSAELSIEGVQVARPILPIELPLEIVVGAGIRLVGPDVVILPQVPADETSIDAG